MGQEKKWCKGRKGKSGMKKKKENKGSMKKGKYEDELEEGYRKKKEKTKMNEARRQNRCSSMSYVYLMTCV
jgi:hypothetical protein